jgi:hypothetical protein
MRGLQTLIDSGLEQGGIINIAVRRERRAVGALRRVVAAFRPSTGE